MTVKCQDCGGQITGTNAEIVAQNNGLLLCDDCLDGMEEEREVFDHMNEAEGRPPCDWFERQLSLVARQGEDRR